MVLLKSKKFKRFVLYFGVFLITLGVILVGYMFYKGGYTSYTVQDVLYKSDNEASGLVSYKDETSCENIRDTFVKDMCYWRKGGKDCYLIQNSYLQHICLRLVFRPHMLVFVTPFSHIKEDFSGLLDKCREYDSYHSLFCIYAYVASLAKDNLVEAERICNRLGDELLVGECSFYIASSLAMDIGEDTSEKIDVIMDFCKKISYISWRSECYYVLADELALTKPEYLEEISDACRKSNLAVNYFCFNHVAILLPVEKLLAFCDLAESFNEKADCWRGLAFAASRPYSDNISGAILVCNQIPIEFRSECFRSLGDSVNRFFGGDVGSAVSACNEVPVEFRSECFRGLGGSLGHTVDQFFGGDVGSAVDACELVPLEFRGNCLTSLSWAVGFDGYASSCMGFSNPYDFICFLSLGKNKGIFLEGTDGCNSITDETFKSWCYNGFGRGLSKLFFYNVSLAFNICNSFLDENYNLNCSKGVSEGVGDFILNNGNVSFILDECDKTNGFSSYCYEKVGKQTVSLYTYNISKAFDICNKIDIPFRSNCFTGIGKGLGEQFLDNLSFALMKCEELPSPYNTDCKQGLEETIKSYGGE